MSDQPSGKVSAQKPASAHLKTVLINTVSGKRDGSDIVKLGGPADVC